MKVHKNDQVLVIRGKDKGKRGKVLQVFPGKNTVMVESVNIVHRHTKQNSNNARQTGIVQRPAPISASNVMVIAPGASKPTRIGYKLVQVQEAGKTKTKKVRFSRKTKEDLGS